MVKEIGKREAEGEGGGERGGGGLKDANARCNSFSLLVFVI